MPAMNFTALYQGDETAWLEETARRIAEGNLAELDLAHLSEYLQSMANKDRREVRHRLIQLMAHLLKWIYQEQNRSRSWKRSIVNQRIALEGLLESGTLKQHAEEHWTAYYPLAVRKAAAETGIATEDFPASPPFALAEILNYDFQA